MASRQPDQLPPPPHTLSYRIIILYDTTIHTIPICRNRTSDHLISIKCVKYKHLQSNALPTELKSERVGVSTPPSTYYLRILYIVFLLMHSVCVPISPPTSKLNTPSAPATPSSISVIVIIQGISADGSPIA